MDVVLRRGRSIAAACLVLSLPGVLYAQASITGVVRDATGAIVPGVGVEAESPALIERVRNAVTDGTGQYRIVDLRPGLYSVTFTLPGFTTVRREGIELSGSFVATVSVELGVSAVAETITVTTGASIVDVQGVTQQRVMNKETIESIPVGRSHNALAVLIPGVSLTGALAGGVAQDVGGGAGDSQASLTIHGSKAGDQRVTMNGVNVASTPGNLAALGLNVSVMEEVVIDTAAVDATAGTGGVRINFIPREGGNTFRGGVYFSGATSGMQGNNLSDALIARGLGATNRVKRIVDVTPAFGGPLKKDKLWFFVSGRYNDIQNYVAGLYFNANAGNPTSWAYAPDRARQVFSDALIRSAAARLTWQAAPKHKFGFAYDDRRRCTCPNANSATVSVEAGFDTPFYPSSIATIDWSSPATSRLLFEAGLVRINEDWAFRPTSEHNPGLIGVTDLAPAVGSPGTYRGRASFSESHTPVWHSRFAASYVTGAHAIKAGVTQSWAETDALAYSFAPVSYVFNGTRPLNDLDPNGPRIPNPTSLTLNSNPVTTSSRMKADLGLFVQDRWTVKRLTMTAGLRFDYVNIYAPPQTMGPAPLLPNRNFSFPETPLVEMKDLSPRVGASYDLFGTGKTALKASINKYVTNQSLGTSGSANNPVSLVVSTATRAWTDGNKNFVPDCDLTSAALQNNLATGGDLCGAFTGASLNFGRSVQGTTVNPATQFGWGARGFNWELAVGIQHELAPRVSVDAGYFRRAFGNFLVTDNRATSASDYTTFSITVPEGDARLPGGGSTVGGYKDITPLAAARAADNYVTFADEYGTQTERWNGVDFAINFRPRDGLFFQGGVSSGRLSTDTCEIVAKIPEALSGAGNLNGFAGGVWIAEQFCQQRSPFLTQGKLLGAYTVPRILVQVSATLQSLPGPHIAANFVAANAAVAPSLGRALSGNAQTITLSLLEPGTLYGDRLNQLDLRVGKVVRLGRTRSLVSLDLYNALNGNSVLTENLGYSVQTEAARQAWRRPNSVLPPRLVKVSMQFDF